MTEKNNFKNILEGRSLKDILEEIDNKPSSEAPKGDYTTPIVRPTGYAEEELRNAFVRISNINEKKIKYITREDLLKEKARNGALRFKRKVLGYLGLEKNLTIDELVHKFLELKMFDSEEKAREILLLIDEVRYNCGDKNRYIVISRFENFDGKTAYNIKVSFNMMDQ